MKKIFQFLLIILSVTSSFAQGISFQNMNLDKALAKAKSENKIVFIDAYTVWCGPCKWMVSNVFNDSEVGDVFNDKFVSLKINMERAEGISLASRYNVTSYPTYLFLDSDGELVYRSSGKMSAEDFMKVGNMALEASVDPDNISRLSARYESDKNSEKTALAYINKLFEVNAKGYFQVLEHYLSIQTTMKPESSDMALFLAKHSSALIYGGVSDKIIQENFLTEGWRRAVRKDVRNTYKNLPKFLADQTLNYAVEVKDSSFIDIVLLRLKEAGFPTPNGQRQRLMIQFYDKINDSAKFKQYQLPIIEAYYNSKSVKELHEITTKVKKMREQDPKTNMVSTTERYCGELKQFISQYSKFAKTPEDSVRMIRWAEKVYQALPEDYKNLSYYANVMYLFGDKKEALNLKKEALNSAIGAPREEVLMNEYEDMKAGKVINL